MQNLNAIIGIPLDDLLNIDFTKSDILPEMTTAKPASVIKSDNPITNDILSLYNLPPKQEAKEESKQPEGNQFLKIMLL